MWSSVAAFFHPAPVLRPTDTTANIKSSVGSLLSSSPLHRHNTFCLAAYLLQLVKYIHPNRRQGWLPCSQEWNENAWHISKILWSHNVWKICNEDTICSLELCVGGEWFLNKRITSWSFIFYVLIHTKYFMLIPSQARSSIHLPSTYLMYN